MLFCLRWERPSMQKDVKLSDKKTKQNIKKKTHNLRKKYARAILKATNSEVYKN